MKILRFLSIHDGCDEAVQRFFNLAGLAINAKNVFQVAIAGGNTIKPFIETLVKNSFRFNEWEKINFYWVDERWVPHDHPESNFGNALKYGLINLKSQYVPFNTSLSSPEECCQDYEKKMIMALGDSFILDFVVLGAGEDGHVASIFHSDIKAPDSSPIICTQHPTSGQIRVTLSMNTLAKADNLLLLIFGEPKRKLLNDLIDGTEVTTPVKMVASLKNGLVLITDLNE